MSSKHWIKVGNKKYVYLDRHIKVLKEYVDGEDLEGYLLLQRAKGRIRNHPDFKDREIMEITEG